MQSALQKIQTEAVERKRILKKSKALGLTSNVILKHKRKKKGGKAKKSQSNN
jgi:hypothetical protein